MTQADVLTAIDDALDTGVATETDPVARELQELALMLRADAPEPTDAYSESLDKRVEQGFPKRSSSKSPWWRPLLQPAAVVGMVAIPVLVITALAGGLSGSPGDDSSLSSGGSMGGGAAAESSGGGRGAGDSAAGGGNAEPDVAASKAPDTALLGSSGSFAGVSPAPPSGRGFAPGRTVRKIERTVSLEVEAPVDEMGRVADQVTAVTNRHGGFVLSSSVSTGDGAGGDFSLRIPSTELRPALNDLSEIADVRSQSQTGRDVTPEHVTARQRLRAARAERKSLLRRL